jgi:hypothetical protein
MYGGIELTGNGATIWNIVEALSLLSWAYAAFAASRLLRAPVRSALRRRAGRAATWMVVGAALTWIDAGVRLATGTGVETAVRLTAAVVATLAAVRVVPRLAAVARYEFRRFRDERSAATSPAAIVPIQATAILLAFSSVAAWSEGGALWFATAGAALVCALWALQRRRHGAADRDDWRRPRPLRLRLRAAGGRLLAATESN